MAQSDLLTEATNHEEEAEGRNRRADPELLTMGRMLRLLEELDLPAQVRVVAWLESRFREDCGK